jgi:hypothetical protein
MATTYQYLHAISENDYLDLNLYHPGSAQTGDLLFLAVKIRGTTVTMNTVASGWTKIGGADVVNAGSLSPHRMMVLWKVVQAGDPDPYVFGFSGAVYHSYLIVGVRGVAASALINQSTSTTGGNVSSLNAPSVTTDVTNTLALAFFGANVAGAVSTAGWTTPALDDDGGLWVAYKSFAAAGATGVCQGTGGDSDDMTAFMIAVKSSDSSAGASGPSIPVLLVSVGEY